MPALHVISETASFTYFYYLRNNYKESWLWCMSIVSALHYGAFNAIEPLSILTLH